MNEFLLVTGGCRSGKSRFALQWAEACSGQRLFLATARATDKEMAERIRRHRRERGKEWLTVEEPLDVEQALQTHGHQAGVILIDCITIWTSNLLLEMRSDERILQRTEQLVETLGQLPCSAALVTNEVGWGVHPAHPLGRRFRDIAGMVNQSLARSADRVVLLVSGIPITIKSGGRANGPR